MAEPIVVSISPHIVAPQDTRSIMRDVVIALLPSMGVAVYLFGIHALIITLVSVAACVVSEYLFKKISGKPSTLSDHSAVVTGILFAFCLPPGIPWWTVVIGAVLCMVVGKELFGGIGYNPFNPALVGRAFLLASWPVQMTSWSNPVRVITGSVDSITQATPLMQMKDGPLTVNVYDLFLGQVSGSIGEVSALALLIGAGYLLIRRVIDWRIPFSFIATVALMAFVLKQNVLFHLLAGGVVLGAFFMATDYVSSPVTTKGKIVFGIGCGVLTMLIRLYGGFPEGVCYAILLMNALSPIIERYTGTRMYGTKNSG